QLPYKTFAINGELAPEHINFFNKNGFIHFKNFLSKDEVTGIWNSVSEVHNEWIGENKEKINGIPIVYGEDENGNKIVQRSPFTSLFSKDLHAFIKSGKLKPFIGLLSNSDARLSENEKDGVVVNHYINHKKSELKQMGWHTDSARDIFYFQKVQPMLNVGLYLTDSTKAHGGLRVLPGSHNQSIRSLLFKKTQFVSMAADKDEVGIEAQAGDLVIHNGAIWHRVAMSELNGSASRRITMYVPIVCGKQNIKHNLSKTPFYHKLRFLAKK
ncbi:MAG: phytanoyl-CoA dioxygenase family protein, partial [Bacteroidota bacterium]